MHHFKTDCLPLAFNNSLYPHLRQKTECRHCKRYTNWTFGMICWEMKNHGVEFEIPKWKSCGTSQCK